MAKQRLGPVLNAMYDQVRRATDMLVDNLSLEREELLSRARGESKRDRNLDIDCGYPTNPDAQYFLTQYKEGDISNRVVSIYPDETWVMNPELRESNRPKRTKFEKAWWELCLEKPIIHFLHRVDVLSGIGRYGVLVLGLDDDNAGDPSSMVAGFKEGEPFRGKRNLLHIRAFEETAVRILNLVQNPSDPHNGLPEFYEINLMSEMDKIQTGFGMQPKKQKQPAQWTKVHWTRVIHVADNRMDSELFGLPRQYPVYKRLHDLHKLLGGSGEMYYRGAFPGISLEIPADVAAEIDDDDEAETKKLKAQINAYFKGLQRYIALKGYTAKSLAPQVSSPKDHIMCELQAVSTTIGVPLRIFLGSEEARLASNQDTRNWNKKVRRRQKDTTGPMLLRPTANRLVEVGVLPKPLNTYEDKWPDLNAPTDEDRSDVGMKQANAISEFNLNGGRRSMSNLFFLTHVLGIDDDTAREMDASADPKAEIAGNNKANPTDRPPAKKASGQSKK